ncbi:AAA family ATPase [Lacrimispora sp.]|uniref:AAA family ATPase n=1 Tax=Lacrimispora sp. TaxID=2719234 RepID=UPI0028A244B8|nr:ATP-binding protein [Lacrimispora sp.]
MILSFRFRNFRSFLYEVFIDMSASNYEELPSHLIQTDRKKLIKTLAVYGASSSGKTNLFLALASFQSLIFRQLFLLNDISEKHHMPLSELSCRSKIVPCQMTDMNQQPTEMEISFISNQRVYEYGFTIKNQNILEEHLIVDHQVVYTRTAGVLSVGCRFEKFLHKQTAFRPNDKQLFCSVLSCLDIPEITDIMEPFQCFFSEHIVYCYDFLEPFQFLGNAAIEERIYKILENPNALNFCFEQLQKLGIPVADLIIEHGIPMLGYRVKSRITGQYQTQYMDFTNVSDSTLKYLSIFIKIYNLCQKGGILIIDNISDKLQPSIMKFIVDFFQRDSNKNVQLIFTTHDYSILNNQQFRRDEVAFVDINEYQESSLYTMVDMVVRAGSSLSLDLLEKYSAVPIVKDYIF